MKILAAVNVGSATVTQAWPLLERETHREHDYLLVSGLPQNKSIALQLDPLRIQDLRGLEIAQKTYLGTLNLSDAVVIG